jgi:hypothetical protein
MTEAETPASDDPPEPPAPEKMIAPDVIFRQELPAGPDLGVEQPDPPRPPPPDKPVEPDKIEKGR